MWHAKKIDDVLREFETTKEGLTDDEVSKRLVKYGLNEIIERKKSIIKMILSQFNNFLIYILLVATAIAFMLGEIVDAISITAIIIIMAFLGFFQQYKAEKAVEALKEMLSPTAVVRRKGKILKIEANKLVPGDIILLGEGDRIPADARLIYTENLEVDESPLTGESTPVEKEADIELGKETPIAERKNMVFMGTYVITGKGEAVVTATGMNTEVGKIATKLGEVKEEKTLMERELDRFGRQIGVIILVIAVVLFVVEIILRKANPIDSLLTSIALAVAAVPEGLPAIATVILALGARRMAKRNAIVRKLSAVETLGACDVICTDKTGTITSGEMCVRRINVDGRDIEVTGHGFEPDGEFIFNGKKINPISFNENLKWILEISIAYSDTTLKFEKNSWRVVGSPTEAALMVMSYKAGLSHNDVLKKYPRVKLIPFDRFRKRKSTIHRVKGKLVIFTVGAPDFLINECTSRILVNGKIVTFSNEMKNKVLSEIERYASRGLRTIGFAYRYVEEGEIDKKVEEIERDLIFLGFVGIIDPPRKGVKKAIDIAKKAGIKVIMVTGDHKITAAAIAKEIGLDVDNGLVIEGRELDNMSDEELYDIIDRIVVFARVTPEHKARIVTLLKKKRYIVAMTGDGVNDALALKIADIGIAMGIRGTDVAKEAADLVLADDNFATIVEAVKEGRIIYDNVKKPIDYLLTCNFGEVFGVSGADLLFLPPILKPAQILWINLMTDALPALALGVEPAEPDIMERPPRSKDEHLITTRNVVNYVLIGSVIASLVLGFFFYYLSRGSTLLYARSQAFNLFVILELIRAFSSRSMKNTVFELGFFKNKALFISILGSLILQLLLLYSPLGSYFYTTIPAIEDLLLIFIIAPIPFMISELRKIFLRNNKNIR